jgi:hypothetical protein
MTYTIARMNDEGNWVALESFDTYSEADIIYLWYMVIIYPMLM